MFTTSIFGNSTSNSKYSTSTAKTFEFAAIIIVRIFVRNGTP